MKLKYFLILSLGAFLITLIACSEESDSSLVDSPNHVSTRSSNNLSISYQMTTDQIIKPTTGTVKDLCAIDIKMIAIPSLTQTVTTTFGENGEPCITLEESPSGRSPNRSKGNKGGTTTSLCNGVLTHTDAEGTTTTIETEYDVRYFTSIVQSYYYTETQQDSAMNVMILEAQNNGATTNINGNVLTITETDEDGNKTTIIYDMENHLMISSQTTDPSGKVLDKTVISYTCRPDGTIVPDYIINYSYKDNMICSDPVYTVEQSTFDDFQISL